VNDHLFSSALRALQTDLCRRNTWVAIAGISIVLGISGPFETYTVLPLISRLLYWSLVVVSSYVTGSFISAFVNAQLFGPIAIRLILSAVLTGAAVSFLLQGINAVVFPAKPFEAAALWSQFMVVTAIATVIEIGSALFKTPTRDVPAPAILDRLSFEMRAPLVALSVEDHYVLIQTTKGREMVLMRLSDAIKEVGSTNGLQVHRSHWVAIDAVSAATRKGDGAILTMSNGVKVPVSRGNVPAIKAAGLLPKTAHG